MKRIKSYDEFLNESTINESVKFTKAGLIDKLKQKLEIAQMAIDKWGDSYVNSKTRIEASIKAGKVGPDSGVLNVQGGGIQDDYEIFSGRNSLELAEQLAKVLKKYKKFETESTSTPAAAGWSGNMSSTKSGFIRGVANNLSSGGYYGFDRNFIIAIQIGGAIDSTTKKKIMEEVFPLFYMFDEYNNVDGGVSLTISTGSNYDTIGLTCSKYSFNKVGGERIANIINGN